VIGVSGGPDGQELGSLVMRPGPLLDLMSKPPDFASQGPSSQKKVVFPTVLAPGPRLDEAKTANGAEYL